MFLKEWGLDILKSASIYSYIVDRQMSSLHNVSTFPFKMCSNESMSTMNGTVNKANLEKCFLAYLPH